MDAVRVGPRAALGTLYRWAFLLSVHSGFRAGVNRVRSRFLPRPVLAARLDGARIRVDGLGAMRVAVHARGRPATAVGRGSFGMISLWRVRSPVTPVLDRYLRLTSHFGCGEVELAFREVGGVITIHAVRAIARAHAERLGWRRAARRIGAGYDEVGLLRELAAEIARAGSRVRLAAPRECVRYAVDRRLVRPGSLHRTRTVLERRYRRLGASILSERRRASPGTPPPSAQDAIAPVRRTECPTRASPR